MNIRQQGYRVHPWDKSGYFSRLTFWFTLRTLKLGWSKKLLEEDLYDCPVNEGSDIIGQRLKREWIKEQELQKLGIKRKASLRKAATNAFGKPYFLYGFLALLIECVTRIGQAVCLGWLIRYFSVPDSMTQLQGYLSAAGVCLLGFIATALYHPVAFGLMAVGMRLRVAACYLVYEKALKLSQKALGETTVGQMVNILSNDVNRFDTSAHFIPYLIIGPVQTVIAMTFLWQHLGYSSLFGLAVIVALIPFQSYMGKSFSKLRASTALLTDERVRLMNEILSGMTVIKMYTWEKPFAKLVDLARKNEVGQIRKSSILRGINIAVFFGASKIIVFICFVGYILLGNSLTAEVVFVSVSLYDYLRLTMTFFFPLAISCWAESSISLSRIQTFLELEEKTDKGNNACVEKTTSDIWIDNVSAKWIEESEEFTLTNISLNIKAGELLAIVGPVGSGKSSLLMSILGELPPLIGNIKIQGQIGYSSQESWLYGGTIQQNILFGQPMDRDKYERVLHACALKEDIRILPYGDQTLVGEKGVSLSGGQKARVNLARVVYMDADIYLMDDPLSAVDVSVAKHLFEKCIDGHLKKKTRVLITHQVQFLKAVDKIVIMKQGGIAAVGSYEDIISQGFDLLSLSDKDTGAEGKYGPKSIAFFRDDSYSPSPEKGGSINACDELKELENILADASIKITEIPKEMTEQNTEGSIKASTYFNYIKAGGGIFLGVFIILVNLATQFIYSYSDYWLSLWTKAEEEKSKLMHSENDTVNLNSTMSTETSGINWNSITGDFSNKYSSIYTYSGFMATLFVLSITRTITFFILCMKSSVNLHDKMFQCVCRTPISFFDKNPVGRILNRFTKDMGLIDDQLPFTIVDFTANLLTLIAIVGIVIYVTPFSSIPTFVLIFLFIFIRKYYIATSRDLKRLEGTTRSPVFSHLSTSLCGITTIRASGVQQKFVKDFCSLQDNHTSTWFTLLSASRWFASLLDQLTVVYITCVTIFLMIINSETTGGNVGLLLSNALALIGLFQYSVNQSADLENQMTAVERVFEYTKLKAEAALESQKDKKPPADWPVLGAIKIHNLSLSYSTGGDVSVLKNLNCQIRGGEKVGIIGRTGAGKSSIISALFRMTEPQGELRIDDVNVKEIGLHDLRRNISIIPQDPFLFSGSMKRNLDPFHVKSDEELWTALDQVQLKDVVMEMQGGLESHISEGGGNLSVGQRQLICLARALLRKNKILVLDEATANVDHNTDSLIQKTIRQKFRNCTVLTIAHRLNTIMDSDKIMVLKAGRIVEFDDPLKLLNDRSSALSEMFNELDPLMKKQLYDIAVRSKNQDSYNN